MRLSFVSLIAAATAVSAQAGLPTCATTCISTVQVTGCVSSDIACFCKDQSFITSLAACVYAGCSASDAKTALADAVSICQSAGVTLNTGSILSLEATATAAGSGTSAVSATTTGNASSKSTASKNSAAFAQAAGSAPGLVAFGLGLAALAL